VPKTVWVEVKLDDVLCDDCGSFLGSVFAGTLYDAQCAGCVSDSVGPCGDRFCEGCDL